MAAPTLYLFDRFDERLGVLPTLGAVTHTEELGGEDTIEFDCLVAPDKAIGCCGATRTTVAGVSTWWCARTSRWAGRRMFTPSGL